MADLPDFTTRFPGNADAYKKLVDLIASRRALGLVGAGASAGLYPLWPELIKRLADEALRQRVVAEDDYNYWLEEVNKQPQTIAGLIRSRLGETRYRAVLKDSFKPRQGEDKNPFTPVHEALVRLPFRGFVTTNYDPGLLEARSRHLPGTPATHWATWNNRAGLAEWHAGEAFSTPCPILFMHGIHQDLDSIVLTTEDYDEAYRDGPLLALFEKLWTQEELVFVGFGFSDPWWDFLSNHVLVRTNVANARGPSHVAVIGLTPDQKYVESRRDQFIRRYNTQVLFYQVKVGSDGKRDHSELLEILTHLRTTLGGHPPPGTGQRSTRVDLLPKPPEPYKAHEYLLLDVQNGLIGRKGWLNRLDEWVEGESGPTLLTLHAIGGTGKSALAWTWFESLFRSNRRPPGGGMWYSFYEKGASFTDFILKAHQYFVAQGGAGQGDGTLEHLRSLVNPLLEMLDRHRAVLVLDGFERLLVAYGRIDAIHIVDETWSRDGDGQSKPRSPRSKGDDESKRQSNDPDVDLFLEILKLKHRPRVLITSRLVPAILQNAAATDQLHCRSSLLDDLGDEDVLDMFREYGVRGEPSRILGVTRPFGNHALLVKLLAKTIRRDREALGDFDAFRREHPGFDPAALNLKKSRTHVLQFALNQLSEGSRRVLEAIASYRSPQRYRTIELQLVEGDKTLGPREFEEAIDDLEDVGLLAIDRDARTYDLHPLVRNVVWKRLSKKKQGDLLASIDREFEAMAPPDEIREAADLLPAIEAISARLRRGRWDDAYTLFSERVEIYTRTIFCDAQQLIAILGPFLTEDSDPWPRLSERRSRSNHLLIFASACKHNGDYEVAYEFARKHNNLCPEPACPAHFARIASKLGKSIESEQTYRRVLAWCRENQRSYSEILILRDFAFRLRSRGVVGLFDPLLRRIIRLMRSEGHRTSRKLLWREGFGIDLRFERALESGYFPKATALAYRLMNISENKSEVYWTIEAYGNLVRLLEAKGDFSQAEVEAKRGLELARAAGMSESIFRSELRLASCLLRRVEPRAARLLIDDALKIAHRSKSPVDRAKCLVYRSRCSRLEGDLEAALRDATEAYRLSWCDGPPFAYAWGLKEAEIELAWLGATPPDNLPCKKLPADWLEIELDPADNRPIVEDSAGQFDRWVERGNDELFGMSRVDRLLSEAKTSLREKDHRKAARLASEAIELDPRGFDCWQTRGSVSFDQRRLVEAAGDFSRAKGLLPAEHWSLRRISTDLAQTLCLLDRFDEVPGCLKVFTDPADDMLALSLLALSAAGLRRERKAMQLLRKHSTNYLWNGRSHYYCALAYRRLGLEQEAIGMFQEAATFPPDELPEWMSDEIKLNSGS